MPTSLGSASLLGGFSHVRFAAISPEASILSNGAALEATLNLEELAGTGLERLVKDEVNATWLPSGHSVGSLLE